MIYENDNALLRECYELAERYENLDTAKEILRKKRKAVDPSKDNLLDNCMVEEGSVMSDSDKYYFLALSTLRNGSYETQRLEALRLVESALAEAPNDVRYKTLAQIIIDSGR